jgi:hypothetical protein
MSTKMPRQSQIPRSAVLPKHSNHSRTFSIRLKPPLWKWWAGTARALPRPFGPEQRLLLIYGWVLADRPAVRVTGQQELVTAHRGDGTLWLNFIIILIKRICIACALWKTAWGTLSACLARRLSLLRFISASSSNFLLAKLNRKPLQTPSMLE